MAGDPLDLFLDAITNTLGVVMFILLMVVLFGRAGESHDPSPQSADATRDVSRLESELEELQAKVRALAPVGDPELAARWRAAMERLEQLTAETDKARAVSREREAQASAARENATASRRDLERLQAEDAKLQATDVAKRTGFVRVSRFQQDARKAVILAIADGKLSRVRATSATEAISAPTAGKAVGTEAQAREALADLLSGFPSATHRVELLVWQGSFAQAKIVESVLLEMGYDSNPMPLATGQAIAPGAGGVQ